jgi:DNA-binding NarL/FixJ family response regulator
VIELLLDGNSQASIAQTLHVCEGTVSRMRGRAIMELRRLLGT